MPIGKRIALMAVATLVAGFCLAGQVAAAEGTFPLTVSETAGIRRRNDVITLRSTSKEVLAHTGGYRVVKDGEPVPAQFQRVEWPGEPPVLVADFIGHFQPLETQTYALELTDTPTANEPTSGLTLKDEPDAWHIDSSGLVFWTIRKDLDGLLDFSWKETDYIADDSRGLFFTSDDGRTHKLSERLPVRAAVERSGPLAISLRFDYENWPAGADSHVRLEFVRTKSWIKGEWIIEGKPSGAREIGAELNLRLDGPEALIDFGAGDFVYATVTGQQSARLEAGPRDGDSVPWRVLHGAADALEAIVVSPRHVPTPEVHGWAHVMDDTRATALAVDAFGEGGSDEIRVFGDGRLSWARDLRTDAGPDRAQRQLRFWLHFVTMPVHIGARTSPRSMQEPLQVQWIEN